MQTRFVHLPLVLLAAMGCSGGKVPVARSSQAAQDGVANFRAFALEPAKLPPPSLDPVAEVRVDGLVGRAELVQPETEPWNLAPDGSPVLFNDRWVWLVHLTVESEGAPISWVAAQSTLELNDPDTELGAAALPDDVLGDLLFWALQEERAGLEGDLVARTRAAGAFRAAYLPRTSSAGRLEGVVAFPAADADGLHVVAARLTVPVVHNGATVPLEWVFD